MKSGFLTLTLLSSVAFSVAADEFAVVEVTEAVIAEETTDTVKTVKVATEEAHVEEAEEAQAE